MSDTDFALPTPADFEEAVRAMSSQMLVDLLAKAADTLRQPGVPLDDLRKWSEALYKYTGFDKNKDKDQYGNLPVVQINFIRGVQVGGVTHNGEPTEKLVLDAHSGAPVFDGATIADAIEKMEPEQLAAFAELLHINGDLGELVEDDAPRRPLQMLTGAEPVENVSLDQLI